MLAWTIYTSFLGVLVLMLLPKGNASAARKVAMLAAVAGLLVALAGFVQFKAGETVTVVDADWIPSLGIRYHLAADGISLTLVLLTGLAAVAGILFSWNIEHRAKEFFAFYLALIGGVYGVFLSFDAFLLFVFYEIAIIPKYFIIAIWGSTRKEYGAMKLALYSFVGSALVLVGLIAAYVVAGAKTMSLIELAKYPFPHGFQMWAFPLVFVGFAILAGLWPFHTWAPTGHVAAPTAASMLLAGVVMKLGAYGCLRVAMTVFPEGLEDWGFGVMGFHSWRDVIAVLAVIGIVYGAMVALVQKDFKFVIGYSSVSHMGFVLLGLVTLHTIGLSGAVLQMFSHGVIAGLLFAVVGRMVYDRTHTRELSALEGMNLSKAIPFAAATFVIAGVASMGLPGFSGFVAELQVLIGAWKTYPTLAVITGVGILVGVAYTLRAVQKAFFGERHEPLTPALSPSDGERAAISQEGHQLAMDAISIPERIGAVLLIGASLLIGLYPRLLLDVIVPSFNSPLFDGLRKVGLQ
ncbi:MAG TPA: NADH-quinone oxidoreductase subunit M [Verrucomicrobiae bacterium]|nr:NADH-quinone oxidoreductase subunit M [Verrucomicrobiae bacterium]